MKTQVTKIASNGVKVTATWVASMLDKSVDGYVYGQELVSYGESVTLEKDGVIVVAAKDQNSLCKTYPDMPAHAAGVIRGRRDGKEIVQPLSQEVYDLVKAAITQAQAEAESGHEKPQAKTEIEMVINPAYAHMTQADIATAERNYDAVNNEGAEGYNPYRDNLLIPKA